MAKKAQPKGKCYFCEETMTRRKLFNHLKPGKCAKREEATQQSEKSTRKEQKLFHLRAKLQYSLAFWFDLEIKGSATLENLDHYLREIWLECCGHLSEFSRGDFFGGKISMKNKIEDVFNTEKKIYHSYDFGTTSETIVELISVREGKPLSNNPMFLMSRNKTPDEKCLECGKNATHMCIKCLYENQKGWMYCDEHTEEHPCEEYGEPIELVNSPRLGACGYEGPADPPY